MPIARLSVVLLLAFSAILVAGEAKPDGDAPPGIDTELLSAEQLLTRLPRVESVAVRDGRVWWQHLVQGQAAVEYAFLRIDPGSRHPVLDTPLGPLAVDRQLIADGRSDCLALLGELVVRAQEAGLGPAGLLLKDSLLTGIHLRSDSVIVLPEGTLRKEEVETADRAADRQAVEEAAKAIPPLLESAGLDELARKVIEDYLQILFRVEAKSEADDELQPANARRLLRHGYLDRVLPGSPPVLALKEAVRVAEEFRPLALFTGPGLRIARVADAYGRSGWILVTPRRSVFTRLHPEPMYHGAWPRLELVVELPPGSDPAGAAAQPLAARVFRGATRLASWSASAGFAVQTEAWRTEVPAGKRKGLDAATVTGFCPPHILASSLGGDVLGLIVPGADGKGILLRPPRGDDPADGARFLREASRALRPQGDDPRSDPIAAWIDLVGEHLFDYVYDSPDPRRPFLVGNRQVKGDIHQTAEQTLATACGGICRGDCDDLAELFQSLANLEGRNAIVVSLPKHAACAWAERLGDGQWHVYVLQTGPALEFSDESLSEALRKAYLHFDKRAAFDPNGLGLLLRFAGENKRGAWRLSWRIFSEPDYCRTMVDVQRDWHYFTYQRGIAKMQALLAKGDTDTANYRELSGLYSFTGQHALAAEYHEKALAATKEPDSRFLMGIELLGHRFSAGQVEQARSEAQALLGSRLGEVRNRLGAALAEAGLDLAATLTRKETCGLASQALAATVLEDAAGQVEGLAAWVRSPRFNRAQWDGHPQFQSLRMFTQRFALVAVGIMREAGPEAVGRDPELQKAARAAQRWLDDLAFVDVDEPSEAPARYALAAGWYAAVLGKDAFERMLEGPLPEAGAKEHDHTARIGGLAQLRLDLPWIRASVPYWWGRMGELLDKDRDLSTPEAQKAWGAGIADCARRLEEARRFSQASGMESPFSIGQHHLGMLVAALAAQDEAALRGRLRFVRDAGDKMIKDQTAQMLGDTARFLPVDWFKRALEIWAEELDNGPRPDPNAKWFQIAWRAKLMGDSGRQHALIAAKTGADRLGKDDPAFAEEYDFMRRLLEPPVPVSATGAVVR